MHFLTLLLISLMENVTQCHFPHFFGVLELPKLVLSLMRQVANFTASEKVGSGGGGNVLPFLPFFLVFLC